MSHTTPARRTASALAASALLALVVAAPAAARPDPGTGGRDPGPAVVPGSPVDHEGLRPRQSTAPGPNSAGGSTAVVTVDDDAVEVLQIGAGLLAGLALAGAGAALVSRRQHRPVSPA